jgi:hypothetical protein
MGAKCLVVLCNSDMLMQTVGHLCMYWIHVRLIYIYIIGLLDSRWSADIYDSNKYNLNCIENFILLFTLWVVISLAV